MNAAGLFDEIPPDDPPEKETTTPAHRVNFSTGHACENSRARVYEFIQQRGLTGATDEEIQQGLRMDGSTQRPRRRELEEAGLIVRSGRSRNTVKGHAAVVWIAGTPPAAARRQTQPSLPVAVAAADADVPAASVKRKIRNAQASAWEEQFGPRLDGMPPDEFATLAAATFPEWPHAFGRRWTPDNARADKVCRRQLLWKLGQLRM